MEDFWIITTKEVDCTLRGVGQNRYMKKITGSCCPFSGALLMYGSRQSAETAIKKLDVVGFTEEDMCAIKISIDIKTLI